MGDSGNLSESEKIWENLRKFKKIIENLMEISENLRDSERKFKKIRENLREISESLREFDRIWEILIKSDTFGKNLTDSERI